MSMMHERLRYYGENLVRTYPKNHKCICCNKGMLWQKNEQYGKMSFCRLLCIDCTTAYQKYNKGKRLIGDENLILRCVAMRVIQ